MTIKLDADALRYIAALEKTSGAQVLDCIVSDDVIVYVVKAGQLGAAIGKQGSNVKHLKANLGKHIHIVEFSADPIKFTTNLIGDAQIKNIFLEKNGQESAGTIIIESDMKSKGTLLGKGGKNIQMIKDLLKRHHGVGARVK